MGNLGRVLLLFGVILLVGSVTLLAKNVIDINQLHAVAVANRSAGFFNPSSQVVLTAGLSLASGVLLGFAISLLARARRPARPQDAKPDRDH
ncbi:hypothetical protein [Deinococcus pimensis]|uniref:hypothetical protein n=1 Tax=Deinococcus pimensis TaxID=309888 RepID=UPI0005EB1232|nr:hypothetical protein [Deinococcus pimensis]